MSTEDLDLDLDLDALRSELDSVQREDAAAGNLPSEMTERGGGESGGRGAPRGARRRGCGGRAVVVARRLMSERNAADLLTKMVKLGYFSSSNKGGCDDDAYPKKRRSRNHHRNHGNNEGRDDADGGGDDGEYCELIFTNANTHVDAATLLLGGGGERGCVTRSHLVRELSDVLDSCGGRLSLSDAAARYLGVDESHVRRAADELVARGSSESLDGVPVPLRVVQLVHKDLISSNYLDGLVRDEIVPLLQSRGGRVLLSDLATTVFHLPVPVTVEAVRSRMDLLRRSSCGKVQLTRNDRELVTDEYERGRSSAVRGAFHALTGPTSVEAVCRNFSEWDAHAALERVARMCDDGTLPGELRTTTTATGGGAATSAGTGGGDAGRAHHHLVLAGATYVPYIYSRVRRNDVDGFYRSNGYITRKILEGMGVSGGQMVDYVRESFPNSVPLPNSMVNPDVVLGPLESVVLEAYGARSFVDLGMHLPETLVADHPADVREVMTSHILPGLRPIAERLDEEESVVITTTGRKRRLLPGATAAVDSSAEDSSTGVRTGGERGGVHDIPIRPIDGRVDDGAAGRDLGLVLVGDGEAWYFSSPMVRDVESKVLGPLVESYGKERAREIFDGSVVVADGTVVGDVRSATEVAPDDGGCADGVGKGKRGNKKGSGKRRQKQTLEDHHADHEKIASTSLGGGTEKRLTAKQKRQARKAAHGGNTSAPFSASNSMAMAGVVPMRRVVDKVGEEYPELSDAREGVNHEDAELRWEKSDATFDGALHEFCRAALYSLAVDLCRGTVRSQLEKLEATRVGGAIDKNDAAYMRQLETSFETAAFPAACHHVQMFAKLALSLEDGTDTRKVRERNFLSSVGADFAKRMTEYCLIKNGVDQDKFKFCFQPIRAAKSSDASGKVIKDGSENQLNAGLPQCCQPPNVGVRRFDSVYLTCNDVENAQHVDALKTMREQLPNSVGVALARMWVFCGGECYEGGEKEVDGSIFVRPGSFTSFLSHAEDSCLTICGLPFKTLDKKTEKRAMFFRRNELSRALEEATSAADVLELTTILLFQQVKHFALAGSEVDSSLIDLLLGTKSIPESVATKIKLLAESVKSGQAADDDLVTCVKACGLSRDISKHNINEG